MLGLADAVGPAAQAVRELFETKKRVEVTLRYSPEQKGTLLGKGGSTINRISTESGAQLDLGKDDCTIRVHGPAAAVKKAQVCSYSRLGGARAPRAFRSAYAGPVSPAGHAQRVAVPRCSQRAGC